MLKRLFAGLVAVAMTASMMTIIVFADETKEPEETTAVETTEPEKKETEKPAEPEKKETEPEVPAEPEDKKDEEVPAEAEKPSESEKVAEKAAKKKPKPFSFKWDGSTLTLSGDGKMPDWPEGGAIWVGYKDSIKKVVINKGLTSIGNNAFKGCTQLTAVSIPSTVKTIGENAFQGSGLKSVKLPGGLKSIGDNAFRNCADLKSANIPGSVTTMGLWIFADSGLTEVTISNGVKEIAKGAFYECEGLTSVTIPSSVTTIGDNSFEYCHNLSSIKIPYGVTSIGDRVFFDCTSLKILTIPSSVTQLGEACFQNSGIETLFMTLELWGDTKTNNPDAFAGITPDDVVQILKTNYMIVKGKTAKVKYKKLKKKNQTIAISKLFNFTLRGEGSKLFVKTSGNKKITINKTTGKITVKKKLKKGTYKIGVKVLATGNDTFRDSGWKTVTIRIKVK